MSTTQKTLSAANAGTVKIGDLTVNRLGFGAMRITGEGIWGEPRDRGEAKRVLQRAVELDVDLIDTADSYGPEVSERLIGETLWPYKRGLVIATKGGYVRSGPNRWTPNLQPGHLREALEGSLRRLKLDRIDVYQLHNMGDPTVTLAEAIGTLAAMQREGKIRHIGVSNFSVAQLTEARGIVHVVSVQNRYNLGDRASEAVLAECEALGIPFLPWAPLGGNHRDATVALENVARRHAATPNQIAIAALLAHSPMMLPIPGTSRVKHLEENIAAAGIELTQEDRRELSLTS
ncbi:MAG TPA: aldo/keto reductase [Gemmatimonadaceae bacterium]|nr:aldo/keto reductase [Gemmatimonadaceae bacterium]